MDSNDLDLLEACFEARRRQEEMLPRIASALSVPDRQVLYAWTLGRKCRQTAEMFDRMKDIPGSSWQLFFHGFECDLHNTADGRFLRYDFGPGGRYDCVTAWGVLQFIMTAKIPWRELPSLRKRLARTGPPYDRLSGDHTMVSEAWDRLERAGCLKPAAPRLIKFQSQCTLIGNDGIAHVSYPQGTSDKTMIDCAVAHRQVLTARARALLEERGHQEPVEQG